MNYSRQRSLILDIVKNTKVHPTADWVYQEARKKMPSIGIATVYRNLNALVELGECRRLTGGDGQDRFDGMTGRHYHMKCRGCGCLMDLKPKDEAHLLHLQEILRETFPEAEGGVQLSEVLLDGFCEVCREKKKEMN